MFYYSNRVLPTKFGKILLDTLKDELPNVSISRPSSRMTWGIDVLEDPSQKIYVWLDALVNYLTVANYPNQLKTWPPNVQVIGKDILKFHGVYWPAFLIAAGIEPPQQLLVHSHWTVEGQKMSKSKNNVINPVERANLYTIEGIRYFLLREGVQHSDGSELDLIIVLYFYSRFDFIDYSDTKILRILNSELADTFGNLLSRACAKTLNPRQIFPQIHNDQLVDLIKCDSCKDLIEKLSEVPKLCRQHYSQYSFHLVADNVMTLLHSANNFFENAKPWELKAGNEEKTRKLETIISLALEALRVSAIVLQPMIPDFTDKLLNQIGVPQDQRVWKDTKMYFRKVPQNLTNLESNILFKRIILENDKQEKSSIKKKNA